MVGIPLATELTGPDRPDLVVSGADPGPRVGLHGVNSITLAAAVVAACRQALPMHHNVPNGNSGTLLGQSIYAAGSAGRNATASISIFAFSSRPATCMAVLVGGSCGKNSPRIRENTA